MWCGSVPGLSRSGSLHAWIHDMHALHGAADPPCGGAAHGQRRALSCSACLCDWLAKSISAVSLRSLLKFGCERARAVAAAIQLFEFVLKLPVRVQVTFNSLIAACAQGAQWEKAAELFEQMHGRGCRPDPVTYGGLISAYERVTLPIKLHSCRRLSRRNTLKRGLQQHYLANAARPAYPAITTTMSAACIMGIWGGSRTCTWSQRVIAP